MSKKKRRYGRSERDQNSRAQAGGEQPVDETLESERAPVPERPTPKKFNAPLWAGIIVVIAVVAVLGFNMFGSKDHLTVDSLNKPAVAALDGGSEVYPANSKLAFTENTKFGYLPAPTLSELGDGTIVAADPKTAPKEMELKDDLPSLDRDSFLDQTIKPPRKNTAPGEPITWDQMVDEMAGATVLMPLIESPEVATPVLKKIAEADIAESVIVRTDDAEVAKAASDAKVAVMFTGDYSSSSPEGLEKSGYSMVAVAPDAVSTWTESDLKVWVTGVKDEKQLKELADAGIFGALSTNPYTIQPSDVKSN
ncbi:MULTISPECIES: hypothetical protein [Brevibacterium]|uniref:Glycerophosphoryl diester phosphodiesterase family protein n=2 Tax=Brevibacterium antiquum TaxID=234835 RepID=A0A2H1KX77_9MICO|nr:MULTISPECIES: hypothetical protein [Brevibacterium]SMX93246.1 hypothetical protein BANT10_02560 [Brevibacterium antiquum]SMY03822.1 hypothetical protein BANT918_02909 [Brevibacterium antiquum CNRZ 918]HCG54705.1 hypothetical protein [Brevibacterium sp.]